MNKHHIRFLIVSVLYCLSIHSLFAQESEQWQEQQHYFKESKVNVIQPLGNHHLLIGTSKGLFKVDTENNTVIDSFLLDTSIVSIVPESSGSSSDQFFIGTYNSAVYQYNMNLTSPALLIPPHSTAILKQLHNSSNKVYLCTNEGLDFFRKNAHQRTAINLVYKRNRIAVNCLASGKGKLLLGTDTGIFYLSDDDKLFPYKLPYRYVQNIVYNAKKRAWFIIANQESAYYCFTVTLHEHYSKEKDAFKEIKRVSLYDLGMGKSAINLPIGININEDVLTFFTYKNTITIPTKDDWKKKKQILNYQENAPITTTLYFQNDKKKWLGTLQDGLLAYAYTKPETTTNNTTVLYDHKNRYTILWDDHSRLSDAIKEALNPITEQIKTIPEEDTIIIIGHTSMELSLVDTVLLNGTPARIGVMQDVVQLRNKSAHYIKHIKIFLAQKGVKNLGRIKLIGKGRDELIEKFRDYHKPRKTWDEAAYKRYLEHEKKNKRIEIYFKRAMK